MKLIVISPEAFRSNEADVLAGLFDAGLDRYHVRKPRATASEIGRWLRTLPREWRSRLVLHGHHDLAESLGLGGYHERDSQPVGRVLARAIPSDARASSQPTVLRSEQPLDSQVALPLLFTSRACHDLPTLQAALGRYDAVLVSPIFPSLSKPGHAPDGALPHAALRTLLANRTATQRRTMVHALGGVTTARIPACREIGFDGIAVIGAVWGADDPVRSFNALLAEVRAAKQTAPPAGSTGAAALQLESASS